MISKEQLAELVRLYDQFHGAFNPLLPEIIEAEQAFFEKLHTLHTTHAADVPFHDSGATLSRSARNTYDLIKSDPGS